MNVPEAPTAFQQEVKVSEDGVEYWLPIQEIPVRAMRAELRDGEGIEVFVVYIGHSRGHPGFIVNAFLHDGRH